jgi:fimbrial chaperone protein
VLACSASAGSAHAASFSVDPTIITLTPRASSTLLVVKNESAQPVRLQVSAVAWSQGLDGDMQVQPTEDVVFFPELFTLGPGQERKIRVGTTATFGASEKSYRLFLEELPPSSGPAPAGSGVHVLTRMGIPIFLAPSANRVAGGLSAVGLEGDRIAFTLDNTGTVHFLPETVRVVGTSSTGEVVIDRKLQGWYVLAGGARRFTLSVPTPGCHEVRSVAIEVQLGATALKERLETPRGTCSP